MSKTRLVLIRHGHRDTSTGRLLDNGLSDRGKQQAQEIVEVWSPEVVPDTLFLSSPRKRCVETLEPLALAAGKQVQIDKRLDEQGAEESWYRFGERVQQFIQYWQESEAPMIVLSSHGDWLPLFCQIHLNQDLDFKKGAWKEIN